ncbi:MULTISPECIES: class I SAM-dependent methyltransferase [unclassified Bosea (in: a-proteobacteria)]|uniref:class I SAM-dependent methyltransferase n=1 Tax=unclassified Bosea (in: a-proteobacteria) TaxID=2653178 RepID=UPI000F763981|nr:MULTISPECIES: class I SAM-dependent methyltransferase [unclassified Bosea (in: a-proteobacteria)]AZO80971.1 hypothetical protein BLM15_27950 [Bosea sp. Tri-49]
MSDPISAQILSDVDQYYTGKLRTFGATPNGVDWRDEASQHRRFAQLLRQIDRSQPISIAEIGCGYGALVEYLRLSGLDFSYVGCDISPEMVAAAEAAHAGDAAVSFIAGTEPPESADYVLASGIFNVRFGYDDAVWTNFVHSTLDAMAAKARRGFAFNALTGFSDADRKEARLWYPDPGQLFNHCIARYGRNVVLMHDYPLYEFTISVTTARP